MKFDIGVKNYLLILFYTHLEIIIKLRKKKAIYFLSQIKLKKFRSSEWKSGFFFFVTDENKRLRLYLWWSMSSSICACHVGGSNGDWIMYQMQISPIVRCRWHLPSIFQLPWKFRSWDTGFASVHTLNTTCCPRKRDRHSSLFFSLSFSLFSRLVESRFHAFPSFTSRCSLIASPESIDDRISISDRRGFTRLWNAPRETIACEFTISPRTKEFVSFRSIDFLLHRS